MNKSRILNLVPLVCLVLLVAIPIALCCLGLKMLASIMGYKAYDYQPVDVQGRPLAQWTETVERVRFSMKPYTVGIGSGNTIALLEIINQSDRKLFCLVGSY
jgi:hypothetical protein